ncbi:MAG: S8 family serine peptidase, partial [Planctomycetota bacterium]
MSHYYWHRGLDTGIDYGHPDLHKNIWQNLGEDYDMDGHTLEFDGQDWVLDPGDINGSDDDGNDEIDDLIGWNTLANNNDPIHDGSENSHGSQMSSIISAETDDVD